MKKQTKDRPTQFAKNAEIALKKAIKRVMKEHKFKNIPIAIWKDGKVQMIPASKIRI